MVLSCIIMVIVGLGVGILSGLLGVGGGTILVPIFSLGFNMSAITCTATSLFTIIPTSVSGMVAHIRNKTCDAKIGFSMGLGGACASPFGVQLAQRSPEWMVIAAVAIIIAYSAGSTLYKAIKSGKAPNKPATSAINATTSAFATHTTGTTTPTAAHTASTTTGAAPSPGTPTTAGSPTSVISASPIVNDFKFTPKLFFLSVAIGLIAGLAGGYVGLGGGFVMIPLMSSLLKFPMKLASGTSLVGIFCIAIPGAITQGLLGNIDYLVGICIACGSIPGALLGTHLSEKFNDRILRFMFAGLLGVAAILLVMKQLGFF